MRKFSYEQHIQIQIDGLSELKKVNAQSIDEISDLIIQENKRLVFVALGKSGLIAKKTVATLNSVGIQSNFLHATEALHGDLGNITQNDLCVFVSNSGETLEVIAALKAVKLRHCSTVCITSNEKGSLYNLTDYKLVIPSVPEVCPLGLAPMVSTTQTLVLGDALASSIISKKKITAETFGKNHPSGNLGAGFQAVESIMIDTSELVIVDEMECASKTAMRMINKGYGVAIVTDENASVVGIVTDGDLRRNYKDLDSKRIKDISTPDPVFVRRNELINASKEKMSTRKVYSALVLGKDDKLVGLVRMHDILRYTK